MKKMRERANYRVAALFLMGVSMVAGLAFLAIGVFGQSGSNASEVPWTTWGGDLSEARYRPFDQINASNFSKLEVAWRFKVDNLGPRPEYKVEGTPLMVHGTIYATGGTRRAVFALDAATGEQKWVYSIDEGERAANAPRMLSGRGLAYWTDGKNDERILFTTIGYRLVALNAKTGQPIPSFGTNGIVDLKLNDDQDMDLVKTKIGSQAAPIVAKNVIIIGAAFLSEQEPPTPDSEKKGHVRGYDVRTGKRLWIFHTVPNKGEFGYDTWYVPGKDMIKDPKLQGLSGAEFTGNTGMWGAPAVDPDLNLAYLPIELPTGDEYGGPRPGPGLFGESIVAVDLDTGKRKWHFQTVHHGFSDLDLPAAPILCNITVNGKAVKALAIGSKQGLLYVLDRATGQPVWPIVETPVPPGNVPGEWYSPTQPIPTVVPTLGRNATSVDELIDFTPELKEEAEVIVKKYKLGPWYTAPWLSGKDGIIASLTRTGGNVSWGGGSYDPETQMVYFQASNSRLGPISVVPSTPDVSSIPYVAGTAGRITKTQYGREGKPLEFRSGDLPNVDKSGHPLPPNARVSSQGAVFGVAPRENEGEGGGSLSVKGLPLWKPPYGIMEAINLSTGALAWEVPHGDTPDNVRNNPALKGMNIPKTGQEDDPNMGSLVTKTMVICGDPLFTTTPSHPRGALLHAYDKATGKELASLYMPAPQTGSPMTYMLNGVQYIVLAIGGGNYTGEYIALRLPKNAN